MLILNGYVASSMCQYSLGVIEHQMPLATVNVVIFPSPLLYMPRVSAECIYAGLDGNYTHARYACTENCVTIRMRVTLLQSIR